MKYIRLTENGFSNARLIPDTEDINKIISKNPHVSWFYSTYKYNEDHKKHFDKNNSVAGIRDVVTNKLWWDFDCESNVENARQSTLKLVNRLMSDGFAENEIKINYSGCKGFHVIIDTDQREFNRKEVTKIAEMYAGDLEGFDESLYDENQVIRIPLTKHNKTEAYCTPLTYEQVNTMDIDEIKDYSKDVTEFNIDSYKDYYSKASKLPEKIKSINVDTKEIPKEMDDDGNEFTLDTSNFDLKHKPKYMDDARWLLNNGYFEEGERSTALLCLAATYRNINYPKQVTYRMLKGVTDLQAKRSGNERFSSTELYNNIVQQVYGPYWKGGQFTTRDPENWLYKYAKRMGVLNKDKGQPIRIMDVEDGFTHYVKNIDKNTIKTGIVALDKALPITIGNNLGIIGSPGSGKTAIALEILKNTSKAGVLSVFASLDMHRNRLFEKLLYKVSNKERKDLYHLFQTDQGKPIVDQVKRDYGNVWFYDRSCPTVNNIRDYILDVQETTGEKVKMVMIDYFERITTDLGDDTAASKRIAGDLQDLVNDLDIALITLVQPNKFSLSGGPDKPILNYTSIKGSSFLYQSFRSILSLWRPFYTPRLREHDNYMEMAILKNDLGCLDQFVFSWEGRTGNIKPMEDIQMEEYKELMEMKKALEKGNEDGWK